MSCPYPVPIKLPLIPIPKLHSPINGGIFNLIPGKLLLFEPPDDAAVAAASAAAGTHGYADAAGRRLFSSAFCAALLADLGAAAVVSFDEPSPPAAAAAQRAAFAAAGLPYCGPDDLCAGAGGRGISLQSLDRFLALVAGSPGPVAVQCRQGAAGGAAHTHLAALMLRGSFPAAAEAEAWMRMVVPGRPAGPIDLELLEGLRAAGPAGRRGRARSLSISVFAGAGAAPAPAARDFRGRSRSIFVCAGDAAPLAPPALAAAAARRPSLSRIDEADAAAADSGEDDEGPAGLIRGPAGQESRGA